MRLLILADPERRFLATTLGASLAAVWFDNWAAPALHNHSPLWALGFLLALLCRPAREELAPRAAPWKWSWTRAAVFVALHAGIIALARHESAALVTAAGQSTLHSGTIASLKLLVLLPALALFPPSAWKWLAQKYRAELIASALVLFTWNPFRLFETLWPWYSHWLGRFVYAVSGMFVAGLGYVPGPAPTLTGPELDVSILFGCSGLNGVRLFQILFGVVLLADWDRLKKMRALAAYFAGLAVMVLANALRIVALVVAGNRVSAGLVARFHVDAGWVFFTSVFLVFLLISYRWLLRPSTTAASLAR
jgi:exosortase/archaeosortase family protein